MSGIRHSRRTVLGAVTLALAGTLTLSGQVQAPASADSGSAAVPAALSSRQLAGQRVIYSYPGLTPPQSLLDRISAGEAAGVIFFGENITDAEQIHGVIDQLNAANAKSPVKAPLLLMTDQEGGKVRRLPGDPEISAKATGQAADPESAASDAGGGAGQNLRGAGMNLNLAPVLDVYRTEGNFIDSVGRSYSKDPATVATLGTTFLSAQQGYKVAATAKHFPGLGAATKGQNTDLGPVTLNQSLSQIRQVDEAPYPEAISNGVKLVMMSWAKYPALDSKWPAGMSSKIIQGELRGRLDFRGVTISDALEAGALEQYGVVGERGLLAVGAGMDLLLASARDVDQGDEVAEGLTESLDSGQLDHAAFVEAANRVTSLRASLD